VRALPDDEHRSGFGFIGRQCEVYRKPDLTPGQKIPPTRLVLETELVFDLYNTVMTPNSTLQRLEAPLSWKSIAEFGGKYKIFGGSVFIFWDKVG